MNELTVSIAVWFHIDIDIDIDIDVIIVLTDILAKCISRDVPDVQQILRQQQVLHFSTTVPGHRLYSGR